MTRGEERLIRGGILIEPRQGVREADILVRAGRIAQVGVNLSAPSATVTNAAGKIVMPGLISAHTHINATLDRGVVEDQTLDGWLMFLTSCRVIRSERDMYVASALGSAELLRNGCTALMDHTPVDPANMRAQAGAVATACADVGIRATVAPLFMDKHYRDSLPLHLVDDVESDALSAFPPMSRHEIIDNARGFIQDWSHRNPLIQVGLGPSGPQRCTDELLEDTLGLAERFEVPVHTHVCETRGQAIKGFYDYGSSIVQHLHQLGFLSPRASLAHTIWIDDEDIKLLAKTGTVAVHNPISNMKLGSGIAPVPDMHEAGVTIALGADGAGCGDNLDMFEVVKSAALLHRLHRRPARWISSEQGLSFCLLGGAAVLAEKVGSLAVGSRADLAILDGEPYFRMTDEGYLLRQLVFGNSAKRIETVLVDGEIVVEDGKVLRIDPSDLRAEAQELVDRMAQEMPNHRAAFVRVSQALGRIEESVSRSDHPTVPR